MANLDSDPTAGSPPPATSRGWRRSLDRPWWQGVGAVVGTIGVIVAIAAACTATGGQPDHDNVITGDCNAQGTNNNLNCQTIAQASPRGDVTITPAMAIDVVYDGRPQDLPRPPAYSTDQALHHCDHWSDWITNTPNLYVVNPEHQLVLTAGDADVVAITQVQVRVLQRRPVRDITMIRCEYGAAGSPSYMIEVDTLSQKTRWQNWHASDNTWHDLPPESIVCRKADFAAALMTVASQQEYLYTGAVDLVANINGREIRQTLGTADRPLRWVMRSGDQRYNPRLSYDWNIQQGRWSQGMHTDLFG
ncbi:MAG: hypothetical protein JXA67_14605 [Micromonosporaceae bacterium]|nr:hypothetical protein [Micromonosporaceae bacterium]